MKVNIFSAITNYFKKVKDDEKTIQKVCDKLLDSGFIGESECLITTALLAKYFRSEKININVKVHFGFIGESGNSTKVIESHLWLSYRKKRIDITAHKQSKFSSEGYILNKPILNTKSNIYFTKGLDEASTKEKTMFYKIVEAKNATSIRYFESASKNKYSRIDYKLIEEFMNDPYELEEATKEEFDDKYDEFLAIVEIPAYLVNTAYGEYLRENEI